MDIRTDIRLDELDGPFLEHYQIKGAKHGIRRFQNRDGSLTPEGRVRYGIGPAREKGKEKVKKDAATRGKEKIRQEIINNPKKITKYGKTFTRKEMEEIIGEIEWNRKLEDVKRTEQQRGRQKLKDLADTIGTVSNLMGSSVKIANSADVLMKKFKSEADKKG